METVQNLVHSDQRRRNALTSLDNNLNHSGEKMGEDSTRSDAFRSSSSCGNLKVNERTLLASSARSSAFSSFDNRNGSLLPVMMTGCCQMSQSIPAAHPPSHYLPPRLLLLQQQQRQQVRSKSSNSLWAMRRNSQSSLLRTRKEIIKDPAINIRDWKKKGTDAAEVIASAHYCKVLVIFGLAFPLAEVISVNVPVGFYEFFYVYLFLGSILFLVYIYIDLVTSRTRCSCLSLGCSTLGDLLGRLFRNRSAASMSCCGGDKSPSMEAAALRGTEKKRRKKESRRYFEKDGEDEDNIFYHSILVPRARKVYGSFYIRMGALLFGIGGLIHSGIEIGVILEVGFDISNSDCSSFVTLVRPFLQMLFVFVQMYFIFLNHKMNIYKNKFVSRFGLMHIVATNLCVWLNVIILETVHGIDSLKYMNIVIGNDDREEEEIDSGDVYNSSDSAVAAPVIDPHGHGHTSVTPCVKSDIMGDLLSKSGPFLYPCTIEYSLICAAIAYMMWKNTYKEHEFYKSRRLRNTISYNMKIPIRKTPDEIAREVARNRYSVDCSKAHNGLFTGIVVLVCTTISLIVFFVLMTSSEQRQTLYQAAIKIAAITEISLYSLSSVAVIIGFIQVRKLWYDSGKKMELDNLLLVVAQTGVLIYTTFCIIGTYFQWANHWISFFAAVVKLFQTLLQTVFILDASNRFAYCSEQEKTKPGRQVITFLIVCNLVMWMMNILETNQSAFHPIQVSFYGGDLVWPIITHVSMPLAIFYRFHSTVCLGEIWTRSFKQHREEEDEQEGGEE